MERNYSDFSKDYFVFVGENASTGKPNPITGEMSFWGNMRKFHSKKSAKQYVEEYRGTGICEMGTARTLRKYNRGCSVKAYLEDLEYIPYT